MTFAHSRILWLLAITVPLLAWFFWWAWRRKQILIKQFVQSRLLAHLTVGVSARLQKARMILLTLAVTLLFLALARPQWGFAWEEAHQRGIDIVIAIDTSRSMLAEDIPPNRLARAKLAAVDLMRLAKSDRLGLVAFAGTSFLQCPLTVDEEAFRQSVETLDVGIIPQGGTALTEAIDAALKAFKDEDNHKVLVLFTDGEDHEEGAIVAAEKAARTGLRIFTIGVGTPNGELLRQSDEKGAMTYIKDAEGNVVKSRLNETLLTEIATAGNGFYLPMSGASTMDVLYERGLSPLPKSDLSSKLIRRYQERYYWPLSLAILLLLLEILLPERKRIERTSATAEASSNAALRKFVALLMVGFSCVTAAASSGGAIRKYETGKFKEAQEEYQRLLKNRPNDPRLHFNAGAAAYQAEDYADAIKYFGTSLSSPDLELQERSFYNLGNALFRLGEQNTEPSKKVEQWEQAVRQYEAAIKMDPRDADAIYNRDLVKKKLEELKKQQNQSKSEQQQNSQDQSQNQKDSNQKNQEDSPSNAGEKDKQQKDNQQKSSEKDSKSESSNEDQKQKNEPKDQKEESKNQQPQDSAQNKNEKSESPDDKKGSQSDEKKSPQPGDGQDARGRPLNKMTAEEVKRLLDAQKGEEKAMIFVPQSKPREKKRLLKDW
jgi:Ca-activated chloride channel homolog